MTSYADTTAIFEHQAGTQIAQEAAREALGHRNQVATSDHVEREWKRIVVGAASAIDVATRIEPDLGAALARLARGFGREPAQRLRVLGMCVGDQLDRTEMRLRAQQLIRADGQSRFHSVVGEVRRTSDCGLATQQPVARPDGGWDLKTTCRKREGICRHEQRLSTDAQQWGAGADALKSAESADLRSMGRIAQQMRDRADQRTGRNCYAKTGDLAIALDCKREETLVTTDHSYQVIGPALGIRIRRIPTG